MILLGQDVLTDAGRRDRPLRQWLGEWAVIVADSQWKSIRDVRKVYPSADGVVLPSKIVVTVFNVKGNAYRLLSWIDYASEVVEVLQVSTHAEYSRNSWKARY